MLERPVWGGGQVRRALCTGLPFGAIYAIFLAGEARTVGLWLLGFAMATVFFGAVMAFVAWRKWPDAASLKPAERVAVVRAVRRGEPVADVRLAPYVVRFARVTQDAAKINRWFRWFVWLAPLVMVGRAISITADGWGWRAGLAWVFALASSVLFFAEPLTKRTRDNAERAAELAQGVG